MDTSLNLRLAVVLLLACLLSACANETVRGRLTYDLRPEGQRSLVYWPDEDVPRYRYVGELVGEPNFVDVSDKSQTTVIGVLKWIAGVFENDAPKILQRPLHGAVSDKGRVYVADAGRNAVVVFDPKAPAEEKSDRGEGQMLFWESVDGRNRFEGLVAVAVVWGNDIAVSDAKLGVVARLNEKGEAVGHIGIGQVQRPTGLAFDSSRGLLFVADSAAHDIKVFDEAGRLVKTIGFPGEGPGEFNAPTHVAFAGDHLYVTDTLNNRVQIFDAEGRYVRHFGEQGIYLGNLTRPKGVAVGEGGVVYVVESYFAHLLAFNEQGELLIGISGSGLKKGEFFLPAGVWVDNNSRVFLADMFNGRIVVFQFLGHDGR